MKNPNKSLAFATFSIFLFSILIFSQATAQTTDSTTATPVTFFEKFLQLFKDNTFSIIGQENKASVYPDKELDIQSGKNLFVNPATYCASGFGLVDVFRIEGNSWYPRFETAKARTIECGAGNGFCKVQVYCMPYNFPTSDAECVARVGTGSKLITKAANDAYIPFIDSSTYTTCSQACSGQPIKCWATGNGGCISRTYTCDYGTYPQCPTSWPFTTESECKGTIPTPSPISNQPSSTTNTCSTSQVLVNGVCADKSLVCASQGGTKECDGNADGPDAGLATPTAEDPAVNALIYNINIDKTAAIPGQQVKVSFTVKTLDEYNPLTQSEVYYIEAGIIPKSTALKWGISQPSGFFSVYTLFKDPNLQGTACSTQTNIKGSYYQFEFEKQRNIEFAINVPDSSTKDTCPIDANNPENYWDATSSDYALYITVKNKAYKDGGRTGIYEAREINVAVNATTSGSIGDGQSCKEDYQCISGTCSGFLFKKCSVNTAININGSASLIDVKKLSLTRDEIKTATTSTLLASSCKLQSECLSRDEYTISCNSVASLKSDGTITPAKETEFFSQGKTIVTNGIVGASLGGAGGLALCALGVGGAAVATFTTGAGGALLIPATSTCASLAGAGALVGSGLGVGSTLLWQNLREDDALVKALKAGDANSVGICTAETSSGFDFSKISTKLGIKITGNANTDSLILIAIGIIFFIFLLNILTGSK